MRKMHCPDSTNSEIIFFHIWGVSFGNVSSISRSSWIIMLPEDWSIFPIELCVIMLAILLLESCSIFISILKIGQQSEFKIKLLQTYHLSNPNFNTSNKLIMNFLKYISLQINHNIEKWTWTGEEFDVTFSLSVS